MPVLILCFIKVSMVNLHLWLIKSAACNALWEKDLFCLLMLGDETTQFIHWYITLVAFAVDGEQDNLTG